MKKIMSSLVPSLLLLGCFTINSEATAKFKLWKIEDAYERISYRIVSIDNSDNNPQGILNLLYKDMKIVRPKIVLIKNEVAYVNIEGDSEYITDRSGTTGASYFAATVVFNLTEFKNIKYVYFVDEGDHFEPGKSERIDFWELMSQSEKINYKDDIEKRLNAKDEKVSKYVGFLKDIGDDKSINELTTLKEQLRKVGYGGCLMNQEEFREDIDETIRIIRERIKSRK